MEYFIVYFITIVCFLLPILMAYFWFNRKQSYWAKSNVPYIAPNLLLGNLKDLLFMRITFGEMFQQLYANGKAPVLGIYLLHTPALVLRDPELIKLIFIKNADVFQNRYEAADAAGDMIGALTLPLAKYGIWRDSRRRMAQLFTSGTLKGKMFEKMLKVVENLEHYLQQRVKSSSAIIEVKEMCALYTTDITAMLMYSLDAGSLQKGDSKMRQQSRDLFRPTFTKAYHFFIIFFLPHLAKLLSAKVYTTKYIDYMRSVVEQKKALYLRNKPAGNKDLIALLLAYQEESTANFVQHSDFIVSQAAILLLAGFETSASLIALTMYELAKQPALQHQLRLEICEACRKSNSKHLGYENIKMLPYLNMIVAEALRLYPTATFINREYTPATSTDQFSLQPFVRFAIPKGMPVYVSILGLHRDERFWPNPEHFDPTRFSPDNINTICPMSYIPFGCGPHGCIGSRLGVLQVKLALVAILRDYKIETCSSTVSNIQFDPNTFMLHAKGDINLKIVRCSCQDV